MNSELEKAILATLAYFDIFDYPLTLMEIFRYLYQPSAVNYQSPDTFLDLQQVLHSNQNLKEAISQKNGFYFLKGREDLIKKRQERHDIAQPKWKIAQKAAKYLQLVPFIKMMAVCNTLAYDNAEEKSDIDFFVVVKSGRMWTARFIATVLIQFLGLRRYNRKIRDRICLSFYVTEDNLDLSNMAIQDDIYLRYWITQVVPLYVRDDMDVKFAKANKWTKNYLPNFVLYQAGQNRKVLDNRFFIAVRTIREKMLRGRLGDATEGWLRKIQKSKMDKNTQSLAQKLGTEVIISDKMLKFHEIDRREEFRKKFNEKLDEYK